METSDHSYSEMKMPGVKCYASRASRPCVWNILYSMCGPFRSRCCYRGPFPAAMKESCKNPYRVGTKHTQTITSTSPLFWWELFCGVAVSCLSRVVCVLRNHPPGLPQPGCSLLKNSYYLFTLVEKGESTHFLMLFTHIKTSEIQNYFQA